MRVPSKRAGAFNPTPKVGNVRLSRRELLAKFNTALATDPL